MPATNGSYANFSGVLSARNHGTHSPALAMPLRRAIQIPMPSDDVMLGGTTVSSGRVAVGTAVLAVSAICMLGRVTPTGTVRLGLSRASRTPMSVESTTTGTKI